MSARLVSVARKELGTVSSLTDQPSHSTNNKISKILVSGPRLVFHDFIYGMNGTLRPQSLGTAIATT